MGSGFEVFVADVPPGPHPHPKDFNPPTPQFRRSLDFYYACIGYRKDCCLAEGNTIVARKRGVLAELNRQVRLEAKRREQAQRQAMRTEPSARRLAEQAALRAERARAQASKAHAAEQKRAEREAKRLHIEAMGAEVAARNAALAATYEDIDGILAATLEVDDYIDLESLRRVVEHPPFNPGELAVPAPPSEPRFVAPDEPTGLMAGFRKKKYAALLAQARASHQAALEAWQAEIADLQRRQQTLDAARAVYDEECRQREAEAAESNLKLDQLIANLGYGVEEAVQEYISIVLSNSVYPESFPVDHDFVFDSTTGELTIKCFVPNPPSISNVRQFKYVKTKDAITETAQTQKAQKDRYANAVASVAVRTLHEVFEADRVGRVQTISLTVATEDIDPGTGHMTETPLVAVASDRASFTSLNLANVVPLATLAHLKASVSKNPLGLVPADLSKGVRG